MRALTPVRTGLDVGFQDGEIPACFVPLKGRFWRSISAQPEFPFEDAQFEAVVMHGSAVTPASVKEAHRVLKPDGCLYFIVPERTGRQEGFTMPDIYATVRDGYNIIGVDRPRWWFFRSRGRTFTICARKKNWRSSKGLTFRPYV